jgi:hypothetical protein
MSEPVSNTPTSLFLGFEAAACAALRIPKLSHRSALLAFSARGDIPPGVVRAAYAQIEANWNACVTPATLAASRQNWRWREPQLFISGHNTSPEVVLERAIVNACERQGRADWSNQVPVASGVAGASAERRRAIDLVHEKGPGHFEFIELKVGSDTPLSAALEIIGYLCVWLLTRKAGVAGPLLSATKVEAIVLAPESYYARFNLKRIQARLDQELAALGEAHGVELSFAFEAFSDTLAQLPITDQAVAMLLDRRRKL